MLGHDLFGMERSLPCTRHMVVLDILTSDSQVGSPSERYHFSSLTRVTRMQRKAQNGEKSKSAVMLPLVRDGFITTRS